jgi:hypothetical protein
MAELVIYPALYMGLVIGLYELILVHRDENFRGSHWFSHGLHAVAWAMAAIFAVMNVPYIFTLFPALANIKFIGNELVFRIAIGLVTMIKIHSAAAVIKAASGGGRTIGQTWAHSFVVAVLIVASPYIWPLIEPVIAKSLPT